MTGVGAQTKALERLGIPHKVVGISEIDKYAIHSYEALHGETRNYGDIAKVEKLDYADFWTYSSPCQDFSVAGRMQGVEDSEGNRTRSGLLFEVGRLLEKAKEHGELPRYLMMENVKGLLTKKFKPHFDRWLEYLDSLGYNNYAQVLNAKHYGVPQNRERIFVISIRKDIDKNGYQFPAPFDNGIRLKHVLEESVEEHYYLREELQIKFLEQISSKMPSETIGVKVSGQGKTIDGFTDICNTLMARDHKGLGNQQMTAVAELQQVGVLENLDGTAKAYEHSNRVYSAEGITPSVTATGHPAKILVDEASPNDLQQIGSLRGCGLPFDKMHEQSCRVYDTDGISPTINTCGGGNLEPKILQTPRGFNRGGLHEVSPTISSSSWENNNFVVASRGRYNDDGKVEQQYEINDTGFANALTTVQKDCMIAEPQVLRTERTEYGKQVRKAYESGELQESRHNMRVHTPREDGMSNTLTTVLQDNLLCEPVVLCPQRQYDEDGNRSVRHTESDVAPTILATQYKSGDNQPKVYQDFRIRKLTARECWRLMGMGDEDFNKAKWYSEDEIQALLKTNPKHFGKKAMRQYETEGRIERMSNSQLYKQAGNSIVVNVLEHMFRNLFSEYIENEQADSE